MGIVDGGTQSQSANPNMGREKPKVVVIMGPTGSGKSRLAIDLASHFPVEIINADSMQVYRGLDVLTNKVPPQDQNGVPHHLLGTVSPDVEFTAKDFRDSAIPVIDDILSRGCLPMIVGGTNYYIQALFSPLLLDDSTKNIGGSCSSYLGDEEMDIELDEGRDSLKYDHSYLKEIDPVSAGRLHPNNHRKLKEIQLNQEDSKMRLRNRSKELALPFEPWPVDQRPCAVPMEPRHLCQAINMHTRSMPQLINVDTQLAHQPIGMHTHSKPDDARIQPNSACYVSHPHTWRIFYSKENSSLSQG